MVQSRGPEWKPATEDETTVVRACTEAAQEKLHPLVTYPGSESSYEIAGTEWTVRTSVNHKTKWADHWYDVTCVVSMPGASVRSVETAAKHG